MVALKSHQVDAFVARPAQPVVLVFGPDSGLVRERAQALVRASVDDINDPFSLARLDCDELAGEPTRVGAAVHPAARRPLLRVWGGARLPARRGITRPPFKAPGGAGVEREAVVAITADAWAGALDARPGAAFAGKTADVEFQFAKARTA